MRSRSILTLIILFLLAGCGVDAPIATSSMPTDTMNMPTNTAKPAATATRSPTETPAPPAIALEDQFAYDQLKRLGRGVNLGNALEAPREGQWGVILEEGYFDLIKDGGFDSVRVPIRWNAYALQESPYTISTDIFDRVDWVIEQATSRGLAVVINIHHYDELMEVPRPEKERFLEIWSQIATHYQNAPESVIFEILNEPHGSLSTLYWPQYANEAIDVIRQTNPKRTIVVGPGNWNSFTNFFELQLPETDRNLIVTFHYYLPFQFTHQGAEWVSNSDPWLGTKWTDDKDALGQIEQDFRTAYLWGQKNRRPIYLGEFGAYSKADDESRHLWTKSIARTAETFGFGWAYWEFCAGFGVYDREAASWNEPILSALIP